MNNPEFFMEETNTAECEVLRLTNEGMDGGIITARELAFMSDYQVFVRLTREDGTSTGWKFKGRWRDLEQLYHLALEKLAEGWIIIWHPSYAPRLREFVHEVPFVNH